MKTHSHNNDTTNIRLTQLYRWVSMLQYVGTILRDRFRLHGSMVH